MVNIARFWTWYRIGPLYRTSGRSQRCAIRKKHGFLNGHSLSLLPVGLLRPLQGRTKEGAFTDDACASTKSPCAVSNKKRGGVLFRMSLAPPRNHVAQCPKPQETLIGSEQSAISPSARFLRNSVILQYGESDAEDDHEEKHGIVAPRGQFRPKIFARCRIG